MEAFKVLATIFALIAVAAASGGEHVRNVIHVPYKIHTVHHHEVKKVPVPVPVYKQVPVYKTVEVPVVKKVHVPVVQKVHVPVHVPVYVHNEAHHGHHDHHDHLAHHDHHDHYDHHETFGDHHDTLNTHFGDHHDTHNIHFGDYHQDNAWQWQQSQEHVGNHESAHLSGGYW